MFVALLATTPAFSGVAYWGMKSEVWKKSEKFEKYIYVQGVFDGLIFIDCTIHGTKLTDDIGIEQYLEAIDILYLDYRNALIPVPFLMRVVTLQIEGEDEEVVEDVLKEYRKRFSQK
jgi:hypothetical protein